jgi:hypothetical protein
MNYAELQKRMDTCPTVEDCRRAGGTHAAYGWGRRCPPAASEEGRKAYNEAWEEECRRQREGKHNG